MTKTQSNVKREEAVRDGIAETETGDKAGAEKVERLRKADPATTEAMEQEAADGPGKRGVSR